MTVEQLAVALYEALQDGKHVAVLRQPITKVEKDTERFYLQISDRNYPISKSFAENAQKWGVEIKTINKQYQIGKLKFCI